MDDHQATDISENTVDLTVEPGTLSTVWTKATIIRVMALWALLFIWFIWACTLTPSLKEVMIAMRISAVVGSILNILNWLPYPHSEGNICKIAWAGRLLGNYAIPFAVSLTSGIFARII